MRKGPKPSKKPARGDGRPEPIRDRDAITDAVCDVMSQGWRSWSIDTLLTHPHEAIRMANMVLDRLGRPHTKQNVHQVCRTALSSRKRGDLKRDKV